jgi:hypothetical protein
MAIGLSISEYAGYPVLALQCPVEPAIADQAVDITGTSTQSAAFNASTRLVRLCADASCSIKFGVSPTATLTSKFLAAGAAEYFIVTPGQKVAVIANT